MKSVETPIITTERLYLRALNPQVMKYVMENFSDERLKDYFGANTDADLQMHKERYALGLTMYGISFCYFQLILRVSNKVIGWCGYHKWYTRHSRGELGYVMDDEESKGKGYMKEALAPIIKYGFEIMKLHRIEAMVAQWNEPSLKLLTGNGFVKEGNLREHYFENGIFDDSLMYALLVSEFAEKQ